MIKRELYMSRIRPFIGTELVKVMTGIRRCGKSVMLELIQQELTESGVSPTQFIAINFEDLLASEETVNREFGAYDSIRDNFPKYVVSLDEFDMSRNGIKHRNIRDFLLAEEWN